MVTPARSLVKNTPASLYRQAGKNHTSYGLDAELLHNPCTVYWYVSKAPFPTVLQWLPGFQMFLPFWPQEVELLDTHIHPETHSAVWWDWKNPIFCVLNLLSNVKVTTFFCTFRIWMTATGQTACTHLPSLQQRTQASSHKTSPTWVQHCWRKMTLERLVGESDRIWSSVVLKNSSSDSVVLLFVAAASLFPEFLGAFHKNSSSAVFNLLEDYQTICQDKVGCTLCSN